MYFWYLPIDFPPYYHIHLNMTSYLNESDVIFFEISFISLRIFSGYG